ncbi:hypothetical protein CERSUDRAFT_74177 [Gelatoporia subvermispora B]|uniref:Uncharacterized protein n=1 Tax=Ceriporiopsis subvermispora (strain B) TaxID=914234 RepID=M2REE1_CERS8|nr:hypothetical protein CERSUDRAFT_74177 [Gelatoporia subvermispora B]
MSQAPSQNQNQDGTTWGVADNDTWDKTAFLHQRSDKPPRDRHAPGGAVQHIETKCVVRKLTETHTTICEQCNDIRTLRARLDKASAAAARYYQRLDHDCKSRRHVKAHAWVADREAGWTSMEASSPPPQS